MTTVNNVNVSSAVGTIVLSVVLYFVYRISQVGKRKANMPPGPPTIPILGNALQIPVSGFYKQMLEWSRTYGKVYSLTVGSSNIIILCDRKAVHALIDKKSAIYSDRPSDYVGYLLTQGDHMALHQMDKVWREMRKHIAHHFSPMQCDEHHQIIQESETRALMNDFLDTPELFRGHIRRTTSSISSIIVYGQRGPTIDHKYARQVYDVMERWTETMEPGANPPVDVFPILKLIPIRFAAWKQRALRAGKTMDDAWGGSLKAVRDRRASGEKRNCVADKILDDYEAKGDQLLNEHTLQNLLGEMVEGGSDTTSSQLLTFIMAMATYPRVQAKAHKLMDEVIGSGRSPTWADFDNLQYVNAMVKEGMRWRPVSSVALPHRAREDDTYEGMFIPKDSTVWVAVWALNHDPDIFDNPDEYRPERYENHNRLAPHYAGSADYDNRDHYTYGAGRRICPGMHLGERNMWRVMAKIIWGFNIEPEIDPSTGKPFPIDVDAYNSGILQAPLPFRAKITPRSQVHVDTIRREWLEYKDNLAPFE